MAAVAAASPPPNGRVAQGYLRTGHFSLTLTSITTLCYNFLVLMEKEQIINKTRHMRVYLDNCCYNRPFDVQTQTAIKIESDAKLLIQGLMRTGVLEYAWSFMLRMEVSRNPDYQRKRQFRIGRMGRQLTYLHLSLLGYVLQT